MIFIVYLGCKGDFGFVLDCSGSVEGHWDLEKSFVKQIVRQINISPNGGRAGITEFSTDAELKIKFSYHTSLAGFENQLDNLDHLAHGTTRIDRGLELALDAMFQESNGMRPNVTQNLVLITDAQQVGVDFEAFRKRFNEQKIRVIVILVGNVRKDDIRHLVNVDSDLYIADDYDQLISDSFIQDITLCEGKKCLGGKILDIFMIFIRKSCLYVLKNQM